MTQTTAQLPCSKNIHLRALLVGLTLVLAAKIASAENPWTPPQSDSFQTTYGMVWSETPGESRITSTHSFATFLARNSTYQAAGFQLVDFELAGEEVGGVAGRRFAGIWHQASIEANGFSQTSHLIIDLPIGQLDALAVWELTNGYRLVDLEVYQLAGWQLVAAVFHPHPMDHHYALGLSRDFLDQLDLLQNGLGRYLVDVETYQDQGQLVFAAVWHEAAGIQRPPVLATDHTWPSLLALGPTLGTARQLADLELSVAPNPTNSPLALGLWVAPHARQHILLSDEGWQEFEALQQDFDNGTGPMTHGLPVDLEIIWHREGEAKSGLTVTHNGPMIPPGG